MPVAAARPLALSLALALFSLYLLSSSLSIRVGGDESILFGTVDSLVKRGSFEVDQLASIPKGDPDAKSADWDYGFYGRDGRQYGKSGLGHVLLLAPLEALALRLPGVGLLNVAMLFSPLVTAATAALLCLLAARLGYRPRVGLALGLLYGVATFAWPFAKTLFPEPPSALLLLLALWFTLAFGERPRYGAAFGVAVALGLAFWVKGTNLVVGPVLAVFMAWRLYRGRAPLHRWLACALAALAPLTLAALVWGAFNVYRFGDPLQAGYDFGFTTPLLHGLYGLLLSPGKGFFWYSPILLAALVAAPAFIRRHGAVAWLVVACALAQLPVYATWRVWTGGWAWGPRFLLPATPFVALLLLPLLDAWAHPAAGWRGRALAALTGLSLALQLEGVAVHYALYLQQMVPLDRVSNSVVVFQLWASPLLGQTAYLQPRYLDLAWLGVDDDGQVAIHWAILAPLLVATLVTLTLLALHVRAAGPSCSPASPAGRLGRLGLPLAALVVLCGTVAALRAAFDAEDPSYRRLVRDLAEQRAAGYVFSNYANEASFLNLNRSPLPGLGLPDAPRLSRRAQLLLAAFDQRTRPTEGAPRWLVQVAQARPGDPDTAVERWLASHGFPTATKWYGTIRLNRFLFLSAPLAESRDLSTRFGSVLVLRRVAWSAPLDWQGQHLLPVSLLWSRDGSVDGSYRISVQLLDGRGTLLAEEDGVPVGGAYPTTAWRKGEMVADNWLLALPAALDPGECRLAVSVSDPRTGARLAVVGGEPGPETDSALVARPRLP